VIALSIFPDGPLGSDLAIDYALGGRRHERDGHGRPYVPDDPELRLSVSHAGDVVLVALARGSRVGVDVEAVRERGIARLPAHALTERELEAFACDPSLELFLSYWTRKEALLKAAGVGLAVEPSLIDLPECGPGVSALPEQFGAAERWYANGIWLDGYVVALAADEPAPEIRVCVRSVRTPARTHDHTAAAGTRCRAVNSSRESSRLPRLHRLVEWLDCGYAAEPNRATDRIRRRSASTSRSRGAADVTSSARSRSVAIATAATARSQASAFAFDGFCIPLTLRTYWTAAR
jgi:4'-phosphopantetheinyl transferase superfamily